LNHKGLGKTIWVMLSTSRVASTNYLIEGASQVVKKK